MGGGYHVTLNRCADTSLLCNPNLLDNSNFQINQRDIIGLQTGWTWLQDRWFCAAGNIQVMDGYIILKNPAALGQRLEEGLETGYYTISAKTDPGHTVSFSLGNWAGMEQNAYAVANADGYVSATLPLTHENNKKSFIYIHAAGSDVPIYKVKLEYGHICTLYNEPAPNPTAELLKCQRFLERLGNTFSESLTPWVYVPNGQTYAFFPIYYSRKRIIPTIMFNEGAYRLLIVNAQTGNVISGTDNFTITINELPTENMVNISVTFDALGVDAYIKLQRLDGTENAFMLVSAEL